MAYRPYTFRDSLHFYFVHMIVIVFQWQFLQLQTMHIAHTWTVFTSGRADFSWQTTHQPLSDRRTPWSLLQWFTHWKTLQPPSVVSRFPRQRNIPELALNSQLNRIWISVDSFTKWPVLHMTVSQLFTKQALSSWFSYSNHQAFLNSYLLLIY